MAFEFFKDLFGYSINNSGDRVAPNAEREEIKANQSFAPPDIEDGAMPISSGVYYSSYMDFDGGIKSSADMIRKYREMALYPEVEMAIDDICNESIVYDDSNRPVEIMVDNKNMSPKIKAKITEEFDAKDKLMQEWYSRTLELVSSHKLSSEQIQESIYCTSMKLRHSSDELFKFATLLSIPMYVISAGIKEIIIKFLEMSIPSEFLTGVTLIANACSKQTMPYVTTTNKDKFLHRSKFPLRRNAILIGDLTEDVVMVANSDYKNVIKIGFMNGVMNKEYSQTLYTQSYDVVIKGNGSMDHVLYLLSVIAMKPYVYKPNSSLAKCMNDLQNK
jgi:2-hydroxy-3-keto-5-methylthiopentenyl-1-phosphate phosphatase